MKRALTDKEEAYVDNLASVCGRLAAVVEWCVNNDGETLGDNQHQLSIARDALTEARKLYAITDPYSPNPCRGARHCVAG